MSRGKFCIPGPHTAALGTWKVVKKYLLEDT